MQITETRTIEQADVCNFCWSELRKFYNINYTRKILKNIHKIDKKHEKNLDKQAIQIKYCLQQAREYQVASNVVTLSTKPLLIYYSIMSLALAEILFKQDGNSSLDRSRGKHGNHGLNLIIRQDSVKSDQTLSESAKSLIAIPRMNSTTLERFGTFELWHRTSRDAPICGVHTNYEINNTRGLNSTQVCLNSDNIELQKIPSDGISLYECLLRTPSLWDYLVNENENIELVRGKTFNEHHTNGFKNKLSIMVHPTYQRNIEKFCNNIKIKLEDHELLETEDLNKGIVLHINTEPYKQSAGIYFPPGATFNKNTVYFWTEDQPLNEFGYLYTSFYIIGNYARYYPDLWMKHIESSTPLSLVVEKLIQVSESRIPLLLLNELSLNYHLLSE